MSITDFPEILFARQEQVHRAEGAVPANPLPIRERRAASQLTSRPALGAQPPIGSLARDTQELTPLPSDSIIDAPAPRLESLGFSNSRRNVFGVLSVAALRVVTGLAIAFSIFALFFCDIR
jgi:hypothetical protein